MGNPNAFPADTADLDWDTNTVEQIPKDLVRLARVSLGAVDMGAYEIYDDAPPEPPEPGE